MEKFPMRGESPDQQSSPGTLLFIAQYVALYILWFVISGIGLWLVFLIRDNLVEDIFFLRINPWQLRAVDRWAIFGLGAVWIVSVFLVEGYLRRLLDDGRFLAGVGRILLVELCLVALSFLIRIL